MLKSLLKIDNPKQSTVGNVSGELYEDNRLSRGIWNNFLKQ